MITLFTGTKYQGTWKDGKREGHGELIHANHKYVGTYKEDRVSEMYKIYIALITAYSINLNKL